MAGEKGPDSHKPEKLAPSKEQQKQVEKQDKTPEKVPASLEKGVDRLIDKKIEADIKKVETRGDLTAEKKKMEIERLKSEAAKIKKNETASAKKTPKKAPNFLESLKGALNDIKTLVNDFKLQISGFFAGLFGGLIPIKSMDTQRGRGYTKKHQQKFIEKWRNEGVDLQGGDPEIITAALDLMEEGRVAEHCWHWSALVYERAGYDLADWKSVDMIFNKKKDYEGKRAPKGHYVEPELLIDPASKYFLKPGDHLYVNNRNTSDDHGNHSAIFLGWIDKKNYIARTVSGWGGTKPGREDRPRDLSDQVVTWISRPKKKTNKQTYINRQWDKKVS